MCLILLIVLALVLAPTRGSIRTVEWTKLNMQIYLISSFFRLVLSSNLHLGVSLFKIQNHRMLAMAGTSFTGKRNSNDSVSSPCHTASL